MASQELMDSIEEYNSQLTQVSLALQQNGLESHEKEQLEELQQNLLQLLELTLDQLNHLQQQREVVTTKSKDCLQLNANVVQNKEQHNMKTEEEIRLDEELALFKSEIAELEGITEEPTTDGLCVNDKSKDDESSTLCTSNSTTGHLHSLNERNGTNKYLLDGVDQSESSSDLNSSLEANITLGDNDDNGSLPLGDVAALLASKQASRGGFVKAWTLTELRQLEGAAVCAPYTEEWGGHTYHNAVVMSVGDHDTGEIDLTCPQAVVLFSQPTSVSMLPCQFFLSDTCHYTTEDCQYSHGLPVLVSSLQPYCPPDSSSLQSGFKVLCQHSPLTTSSTATVSREGRARSHHPRLWHPGTVEDVLISEGAVSVQCVPCGHVVHCALEQVVPLAGNRQDDDGPQHTRSQFSVHRHVSITPDPEEDARVLGERSGEEDPAAAADDVTPVGGHWLVNPQCTKLGDWEKHTKGIGSMLLERMGYVPGAGLGRDGEGRVDPVPAYLYPPGVSLDRCMELRERDGGGGEDLLNVEKRLVKEQLKEERRREREEARQAQRHSLFDVINQKLAGQPRPTTSSSSSSTLPSINVGRQQLRADTSKALNIKGYQLESRVRQLERDVDRLTGSRDRYQLVDKQTAVRIQGRLDEKLQELQEARRAEERVSVEQRTRRNAKKFVVF